MSNPREERSTSPYESDSSPRRHRWRSRTRSPPMVRSKSKSPPVARSRSPMISRRSRSRSVDASNPGNNLYVTGLSTRVSASELEKCFAKYGKVSDCHLVTDPRTNESRGFGFITMETTEDANRCIKHLHRSVLEGRLITVEKAKRSRGRTPTPGRYQGLREKRGGCRAKVEGCVGSLVVSHLSVITKEIRILIQGIGVEDHALRRMEAGEQMTIIPTPTEDTGNAPYPLGGLITVEKRFHDSLRP